MKKLISALALGLLSAPALAECPKGTQALNKMLEGKPACALQGTYTDDLFLSNTNSYVLVGGVFIGFDNGKGGADMQLDPAVLEIQAGTKIFALNPAKDMSLPEAQRQDRKDFVVIGRGSKLEAKGTAAQPIVFTSAQGMHLPEGSRAGFARKRGDWGGIFINGMSHTNVCADLNNCSADGEAGTGYYGGNKLDDNSGTLRYVRVEFGGDKINEEKEYNGITFNGVGSGTTIEYVQVHKNADDGVEFFGGTVNVRNMVITGAGDDSIDWTYGYTGMIQYALVVADNDDGDRGIEADNAKNVDLLPRSNPTISNMTLIGGATSSTGINLRVGSAATIMNSVVLGYSKSCLNTDTAHLADVVLTNNLFACSDLGPAMTYPGNFAVTEAELGLNGFLPSAGSMALTTPAVELEDLFFDITDFVGAVGQDDWTVGWTTRVQE